MKKPLGRVAKDTSSLPAGGILVSVGDTASNIVLSKGFSPMMIVYDGRSGRRDVGVSGAIRSFKAREHRIANPAGHLKDEVFTLFRRLLNDGGQSKVFVDGEEDLTALAAIVEAPSGSVIVYGQPGEGLVIVEVDDKIKAEVKGMIEEMKDGG